MRGQLMVRRRHDEVQRDGMFGLDEIADTPVTARCDGGDADRDRAQEMT